MPWYDYPTNLNTAAVYATNQSQSKKIQEHGSSAFPWRMANKAKFLTKQLKRRKFKEWWNRAEAEEGARQTQKWRTSKRSNDTPPRPQTGYAALLQIKFPNFSRLFDIQKERKRREHTKMRQNGKELNAFWKMIKLLPSLYECSTRQRTKFKGYSYSNWKAYEIDTFLQSHMKSK